MEKGKMNQNLIGKFRYKDHEFYITKQEKGMVKYWIKQKEKLKTIENEFDKTIVKEVIKNLNQIRYKWIGKVEFEGKNYLWYINSFIPQSIFVNQKTKEICEYEENKDLYEKYNLNPEVMYIGEKTTQYFRENIKPKAKVIKLVILGVVVSIFLTAEGAKSLATSNLNEEKMFCKQEEIDVRQVNDIKIGTTMERLFHAILKNNNLTQEEKEFIIQNFGKFFNDAKQYMNEKAVLNILETLKIRYDTIPDGNIAGMYEPIPNLITFHVGNNIEEVNKECKIIPIHEVFHSIQSFGFGKIMEGMTELYAEEYGNKRDTYHHYPQAKLWAQLLVEIFGKDLVLKDSFNGRNAVLQYIPEKIAKLSEHTTFESAQIDVMQLIADINDSIEYLESKKFSVFLGIKNEEESKEKLESVFARLEEYNTLFNKGENNKKIDIYKDVILGTNDSQMLEEGEYIADVKQNYFVNIEDTIKIEIRNRDGGYDYEKEDEQGNKVLLGKIPFKNVIIDKKGNVLYTEDLHTTLQGILEEYNKAKEDYER